MENDIPQDDAYKYRILSARLYLSSSLPEDKWCPQNRHWQISKSISQTENEKPFSRHVR